jgi:IS1 family transposase/transposase-like protein
MARPECWALTLLAVIVCILTWLKWHWSSPAAPRADANAKPTPRPLRPRTPDDCRACRAAQQVRSPASTLPKPYSQVKSPRGRRKRIVTAGYACPNADCPYYGITDDQIHALVGCGGHGRQEYIRDLKCQACRTKFSVRYGTVLYRLKTPARRVGEVLSALAEGLSIGAAVRVFGHGEFTIRTWLTRAGPHATSLHERLFQNLRLLHVQLDELCTKTRQGAHALWVWFAIDARTKAIAVLKVGPRTQPMAHAVVHSLIQVLAPNCLPVFNSDRLKLYFYALTAHFGGWVETLGRPTHKWHVHPQLLYGQVVKHYRHWRLVRVERRALLGSLNQLTSTLRSHGESGTIQTAFFERLNLTVRQAVRALTRRTWGVAQSSTELMLHLDWWRGYYHFTRPHTSLSEPLAEPRLRGGKHLPRRFRARTPAQAVGVTDHRWTIVELLSCPLPRAVG